MHLTAYSPDDQGALAEILAHSFGFPVEDTPRWFARVRDENIRVWRRGGDVLGGAMVAPMGQFFGGSSVPTAGVLGVGVAPEHRGAGAATAMMSALMRELRAQGTALSTLYPATVPLYQRAGYERAGARYEVTLPPSELPQDRESRALRVERLASVGEGETAAVYREHARVRNGALDRGPYIWARVNAPFKRAVRMHGVYRDEALEGYAVLTNEREDGFETEVTALDMVAVTRRAASRLLSMLGDYRSIASVARWFGGPYDVFTMLLPERRHDVMLKDYWMLRVVDVERALAMRGYPLAVTASVTFEVRDEVLPENAGGYELSVEAGSASVRRVPSGALQLDVRALAPLYSGFMSATQLARAGMIAGPEDALRLADSIFAATMPVMSDMF